MDFRPTWVRSLLLFLVLVTGSGGAFAATVDNLYITTVTVTDRTEAGRESAFAQALADVAVRVSGSRTAADRLGGAGAKRYVQRFGYLAQDQLQVGFDPRAVDELLTNAGLPIWGRERPATLVWLQADDGTGTRRLITSATSAPERDAVIRAAQLRGLPITWATPATGLDAVLARQPSPAEIDAERQRLGANALLIGFATRSAPGSDPVVRWQFVFDGQVQDGAGSVESGIHLAADRLAEVFAAASGSTSDVIVEVDGILDLDAYAQTLNYLEGLTLVRKVDVQDVRDQTVRFHVVSRGDVGNLRRALLLSNRLVPQALEQSAPDPQNVRLRFQPAR